MGGGGEHLLVARASALIESWTGITLTNSAPSRLLEFLQRRAQALGYDSARAYLDALEGQRPRDPEPTQLINLVSNGLTSFWRDAPQLNALELALRQLAQGRDLARDPLRIWCAACSTGEEAYTAAMIAQEAGLACVVLGTDVNTEALALARAGSYSAWSLRRLDAARRQRWFDEAEPGQWTLREPLRRHVSFRQHNLLERAPRASHPDGWDVILCRNVLIYFRQEAASQALTHLASAMSPLGYLMLGSSEPLVSTVPGAALFRAARQGAGFVYRLSATAPGRTAMNLPRAPLEVPLLSVEEGAIAESLEEQTADFDPNATVHALLSAAVDHLRQRDPETSLASCEAALCYDPFIPEGFFLMGVLLRKLGAPGRAADAMRKALFLQPNHWLAAFELSQLAQRAGELGRAQLYATQALRGMEADEALFGLAALRRLFASAIAPGARRERLRAMCEDALLSARLSPH